MYPRSLNSPRLGLSKNEIAVQAGMDRNIHAGVQGHYLNNYSSVKNANYTSTQLSAGLALPRRVPFHFISSPRVILQSGFVSSPPISMSAYPPSTNGSQGFTASKWASKVFLENLRKKYELPVTIHRPCSLLGVTVRQEDALNSVIKYSILSRMVLDVPNAEGFWDFKDVGEAAAEIIRGPAIERGMGIRHYSGGVKVPFSKLASRMEELHGVTFTTVSLQEWIRRAVDLGLEDIVVRYLEKNVVGAGRLSFPYMGECMG